VALSVAAPLALGSIVGSTLGAQYIAINIPEEYLKWGFAAIMVLLGAQSFRSAGPLFTKAVKKAIK
jgi:uncharacterized membrane protein YfcA